MARRMTVRPQRGQTLVETALILPVFVLVISGIIVIGLGVFYQQQVTNIAREGARYAAIHSATSDCPTESWLAFNAGQVPADITLNYPPPCGVEQPSDTPPWPNLQAHAQGFGFGLDPADVHLTACWSGWWEGGYPGGSYDAGPTNPTTGAANDWVECTMEGGISPITQTGSLACPSHTVSADDKASNLATSSGATASRVTVYACYVWTPPMAGFLGIPEQITLRGVVTEALQHQR